MKRTLAIILCLAATAAQSAWISGNELLADMNGNASQQVSAQSYVIGAADAIAGVHWCTAQKITVQQAYDMTRRALETAPEFRNHSAAVFVQAALNNAFPCKPVSKSAR